MNKQYYEDMYGIKLYDFQVHIINEMLKYKHVSIVLGRGCGRSIIMDIFNKKMERITRK